MNLNVENANRIQIRFSQSDNPNQVFTFSVNLNMTYNQMFIYSDAADNTYVGNITAPILRIVSYRQSDYQMSYGQIRYVMKRLNTTLHTKRKQ